MNAGITTLGARLIEDAADLLPEAAAGHLRDLRQRETDAWALLSDPEVRNNLIAESGRLTNRVRWLKSTRGVDGGHGLDDQTSCEFARDHPYAKAFDTRRVRLIDRIRANDGCTDDTVC